VFTDVSKFKRTKTGFSDTCCERLAGITKVKTVKEAGRQTAVAVNMELTLLYWRIGRPIHHREVLGSERAAYGEQIVVTLSRQSVVDYGRGYSENSEKHLLRMVQFAEVFPEEEIILTLSRQLSWSHFSALLPRSQPFQREFYAQMSPHRERILSSQKSVS
jgi:hypothetical protein